MLTGTEAQGLRGSSQSAFAPLGNTTIACIATDAFLTKEATNKLAQMAHDGMAQVIRPAHTMFDGDTVFALASGPRTDLDATTMAQRVSQLGAIAATTLARAIVKAMRNATGLHGVQAFDGQEPR
jgi:L-aminopeptidase/D-esterase-like protein